MSPPSSTTDSPTGDLYCHLDRDTRHCLQHCLHKSYTVKDSDNTMDDSGGDVSIASPRGGIAELGATHYSELSGGSVVTELSESCQTFFIESLDTSANDATQIRSTDIFNRDVLASLLSELRSTSQAFIDLPHPVISESPFAETSSEQSNMIGQSPNMMTAASTKTVHSRFSMYSQACSYTYAEVDHHQTMPSQGNKISNSLPSFPWLGRNSAEHILIITKAPVELLREHVNTLNRKWMNKLTLQFGLNVRLFLSTPFETGIHNLQEYYRGILPRTFEDTFALMHIVYACSEIYHEQDKPQFQPLFFMDVLQWHHAIATQDDRLLFLEAAFLLWYVPGCSIAEAAMYSSDLLSQLHLSLPETRSEKEYSSPPHDNATPGSVAQDLDPSILPSLMGPIDLDEPDMLKLRDLLRNGQAINVCMRYLDDFDYGKICERNGVQTTRSFWDSETPSETIQDMERSIIDKLLQWDGVDSFRAAVTQAQYHLRCGLLLNPREVEVKLVVDGRSSNQSQSSYNEYRKLVRLLCKEAMPNSSWLDRYYATDLDQVLSIFYELQKRPPVPNTVSEEHAFDSELVMDEQQCQSTISMKSRQSSDSSATVATSSTLIGSPDSSGNNGDTTISSYSTLSSSPVGFSPPTSEISSSIRNVSFQTKKDQDQRLNLNRHIRTTHTSCRYPCLEPGCGRKYTRSDNMIRHLQMDHGTMINSCSRSRSKKRKVPDTNN
ncbi:hypothetical protein MMC22_001694 [Lobaria immixta]|nr:hypothetical protein [Lobaria immixta]